MTALVSRRHLVVMATALAAVLAGAALLPQPALAQAKPRIGVIGAGRIGGQLARFWAEAGYPVVISGLDIVQVGALARNIGHGVRAVEPRAAAAFGAVVLVSVPFNALPQVGRDYAAELKGKIVLDTSNPNAARDGAMTKDALEKGTGVTNPAYLPGTRLVRAFNTISFTALGTEARRGGERIGVPLAGDDAEALRVASQLVRDAGFEPVVVGGLATAKRFDAGTPVYGKALPVSQLRAQLGVH